MNHKLISAIMTGILVGGIGAHRVSADVTVERLVKFTGGGMGTNETATLSKIKGFKKRDISTMRVMGGLAKVLNNPSIDMNSDIIIDVAKDTVMRLDHKRNAYRESRLSQTRGPASKQESAAAGEPSVDTRSVQIIRNEATIKDTGQNKEINGFNCRGYAVTWIIETKSEKADGAVITMTADLWNTPEEGALKILRREELDYTRAYLKKIGLDPIRAEVNSFGLVALAGLLGGGETAVDSVSHELRDKITSVKGYPILLHVIWRSLSGPAGVATLLFDSSVEMKNINDSTLADGEFEIPVEYKLITR